ncbi:MAG: F0F1 ATP synthase subunit B [Phycisphaerae bacterium]|nr:F0F1 ATP synthase subunit B [Phycisphaerae bacterium]
MIDKVGDHMLIFDFKRAPVLAVLAAVPALASEGGEAVSPFAGNFGNALWTLVIFALVVVLLGKFAWGPILNALQKREEFIRASLDQAKKDREEAQAKLAEHTAQLKNAQDEADALLEQARRDAEIARLKIKEEAQDEADALLERAKGEIDLARSTAIKEIYEVGAQLATSAAGKILGREVDAEEHERLIAESIEALASRRN